MSVCVCLSVWQSAYISVAVSVVQLHLNPTTVPKSQNTEDANPNLTTVTNQTTVDKLQWENLVQSKGWDKDRIAKRH